MPVPNLLGSDLQVFFRFDQAGVWPPVPSEGLTVEAVGDDGYRVLEAPFFVRNIAVGDVVRAELRAEDGVQVLWAVERVSWGGHQTLRVAPGREGSTTTCAQAASEFAALGCATEILDEYGVVALDLPPEVDAAPVKALLREGDRLQRWWIEEACVAASW